MAAHRGNRGCEDRGRLLDAGRAEESKRGIRTAPPPRQGGAEEDGARGSWPGSCSRIDCVLPRGAAERGLPGTTRRIRDSAIAGLLVLLVHDGHPYAAAVEVDRGHPVRGHVVGVRRYAAVEILTGGTDLVVQDG